MLAGELGDVLLKVLRADLVEGAAVGSLERGPEGLDAIRMCLTPDIFGDGVIDRLVIEFRHPPVCRRIVRVDGRSRLNMLTDEALKRRAVRPLDDFGANLIAVAILHAVVRRRRLTPQTLGTSMS